MGKIWKRKKSRNGETRFILTCSSFTNRSKMSETLLNIPDLHIRDVQNTWQTKLIYEGLEQKCPEVSAPGTGFITQCSLCSEPKLL